MKIKFDEYNSIASIAYMVLSINEIYTGLPYTITINDLTYDWCDRYLLTKIKDTNISINDKIVVSYEDKDFNVNLTNEDIMYNHYNTIMYWDTKFKYEKKIRDLNNS